MVYLEIKNKLHRLHTKEFPALSELKDFYVLGQAGYKAILRILKETSRDLSKYQTSNLLILLTQMRWHGNQRDLYHFVEGFIADERIYISETAARIVVMLEVYSRRDEEPNITTREHVLSTIIKMPRQLYSSATNKMLDDYIAGKFYV